EAVPAALQQQPMVLCALEVLKMIAQTDEERQLYEARRKAQMDYDWGLEGALAKGLTQGRAEGLVEGRTEGLVKGRAARLAEGLVKGRAEAERIGVIRTVRFCETLLGRPQTSNEKLASLSHEDLTRMAEELQQQVLKQR